MRRPRGHTVSVLRGTAIAAVLSFLAIYAAYALAAKPEVAEISEPALGSAPLDGADVHMVAAYADGDEDEHVCSDWQIWTVAPPAPVWEAHCAKGAEKVHIHLGDGAFVGSHAGKTRLDPSTAFELRVRFRDDSEDPDEEWSDWAERSFETREAGPEGAENATWGAREGYVVETFATDLQLPVNIAMVPEPGPHPSDPVMYVTELYGTVKVISRDGTVRDFATELLNFNPTGNFPGSGEKGLAGIVVEPETGDVLVSAVYKEGEEFHPKVIRLLSDEHGLEAVGEETVIDMKETNQGPSHQISKLTLWPDGSLIVHNADGFEGYEDAPDTSSFLGKILRMNLDGEPLESNPFYTDDAKDTAADYVWTKGVRNPFGGGLRLSDETYWQVENGPSIDRLARVVKGEDYGWPADPNMTHRASYRWVPAHAPVNIEFVEPGRFGGSDFPEEAMGHAFVTESGPTWASGAASRGKRIVEFALDGDGELISGPETLAEYEGQGKATAVGLAAGADGLYFTDLYKEADYETPIDRGANVLRVRYCGTSCPVVDDDQGGREIAPPPQRPRIQVLKLTRKVFQLGQRSRFVYRLSRSARVRIKIERLGADGPRRTIRGTGRAGRNTRVVPRRMRGRPLRPGRYLATLHARHGAGNSAPKRSVRFRVLPTR